MEIQGTKGQPTVVFKHEDCEDCKAQAKTAETYARVTGSIGATHTMEYRGESHYAEWKREF